MTKIQLLREAARRFLEQLPPSHRSLANRYILDGKEDTQDPKEMGFIQYLESVKDVTL